MSTGQNSLKEAIEVSEDILTDLEVRNVSLTQVLPKCKRLARLRNDFDALSWFSCELNGYKKDNLPESIKNSNKWELFATRSGRVVVSKNESTKKEETKYWILSVSEFESQVSSLKAEHESLRPPTQYEPIKTKHVTGAGGYFNLPGSEHEYVQETFRDVLSHLSTRKMTLCSSISDYEGLLTRIRSRVHDYVLETNYKLKFENITETIFEQTRLAVEKELSRSCPNAIKEFVAAYDRLSGDTPEVWSQAMSSCRRILKEFADSVFPARTELFVDGSGKEREVTEDKIRNRICAYVSKQCESDSKKAFLKVKIDDIVHRIDHLYDLASKGIKAKNEELKKDDIDMCVIETFLLLGYILKLEQGTLKS
ncbi:MAG: hypothetical protein HQL22_03205 [Candidatus Omnitrophica bacterium]|nr:hypothetical protein [Candidatus Omnitrophota bacterium]